MEKHVGGGHCFFKSRKRFRRKSNYEKEEEEEERGKREREVCRDSARSPSSLFPSSLPAVTCFVQSWDVPKQYREGEGRL